MSKYNLKPKTKIKGKTSNIGVISSKNIIIMETYPGFRVDDITKHFKTHKIIKTSSYVNCSKKQFRKVLNADLTNDRVFGKFTRKNYSSFYNEEKINNFVKSINDGEKYLIIGICAYLFYKKGNTLVYADMTRWEIQLRYRNNEGVYFLGDNEGEKLKNFKRGYFAEWRMADRIKKFLWKNIDYFIDVKENKLILVKGHLIRNAIKQISQQPYRLVPYFDAGIWGGDWMQNKFSLGKNSYNRWAWGFDGVPEENSIIFQFDDEAFEMPSINIVFFESKNLLGDHVYKKFGAEFPIRFDLLDTIHGQNLSLQVHPTVEYSKKQFRLKYAQEESYYILDVDKNIKPICYLGLKNNVNSEEFIQALEDAQKTGKIDIDKFVNKINIKKHDHLSHPQGVIHASGSGTLVLEISSTPYIFTFKLWDWGRLGLDGLPRPINIDHGKKVLDYSFDWNRTRDELVNNFTLLEDNKYFSETKTGLHDIQFIETRRFKIKTNKGVIIKTHQSVNMLNLVEGEEIEIVSTNNSFPPLIINYAETFIIPSICNEFIARPYGSSLNKKIMLLQAFVRNNI